MPSRSLPSTRSRRTIAPVAIRHFPNDTSSRDDSRTTRDSKSSFIAETRVSNSTEFSSHHEAGRNDASARPDDPARYPFDSGGRSYGASCSPPTPSTEPDAPAARSSRAHDAAPPPPPIPGPRPPPRPQPPRARPRRHPPADQQEVDRPISHVASVRPRATARRR